MSDPVLSVAEKDAALNALKAGDLAGALIMLFANNIVPDEDTVLADLTEATFDGYARSGAVTWGTIFERTDGKHLLPGGSKEFLCTGATVENTIYGYGVVNMAGTALLSSQRFDAPIPIVSAPDGVIVLPLVALP